MSIVRCKYCEKEIDTDYDAEHFITGTEYCLEQVQASAPDLLKACIEAADYLIFNMCDGTQEQEEEYHKVWLLTKQAIKKAIE